MIVEVQTRYGTIAVTDRDTYQFDWFSRTGMSLDHSEIVLVRSLLAERPKGVVLDVGASFGSWSLALAPHSTLVIAFEPQSAIYGLLCRTIGLNDAPNVLPMRKAIGNAIGTTEILLTDLDERANFGGVVSLCDVVDGRPSEIIPVTTIDAECAGIDVVTFIKIDVEGFEPHVLRGAAGTIARCRPILAVEREHEHTDTEALAQQILGMGYAITENAMDFVCVPL